MKSLTPSSPMDLKSITRTPALGWTHNRVSPARLIVRCVSRYDSANVDSSSGGATAMTGHNFGAGNVGRARHEWQSACAILASKVVSQQQDTEKSSGGADGISAVNGHPTLDLVPVNKSNSPAPLPKPLSIADLSPAPMHGSQLRVAYQGVPGAYSEAAAGKAYPNCEAIPCDQFEVAFQAVELWIADRAVLPVENSLGGSIHRNYDLLLRHRLHIVGEVQLPVHHCLLALPGVRKEYLTRVISHPQALSQCEHTLTKMGLNVVREAVDDTAGAAEYIAVNNLRDTAAIASARAAELYGLQILADGIQDDSGNVTRFVMLAREPIIPRTDRPFKTSIVFAHDKGTSVLFKVLSAFAFRNISLTKIESRPHRNRPIRLVDDANVGTAKHFEYMFYIDFEASMAEPRAQNALAEVQEFTSFLRVLGSYPMDMTPWNPSSSRED
ncbi:Arogenate dehydratase/prephenate dehydratase 6, chloroplastic [Sesamum angolense]|uniref:Arogenate dehydratase n=1 Tax=Sesamum angolense TaxID=2727404 RepID=A0AAE1WP88_9LAMI|nr:Arogenate dehydratase/prephenate dehydratase 6, chloroplastic [Sesamum angolense]